MRQRWYIRGLFATAVGLGVVAGLARAGSQVVLTSQPAPAPGPVVQPGMSVAPGTVVSPGMPGAVMPPGTVIPAAPTAPVMQPIPAGPIGYGGSYPTPSYPEGYAEGATEEGCATCGSGGHRWLHRPHLFSHLHSGKAGEALECSCWAHHDCQGCGSFQSDLHFMFGSCRDFFSEPCLKGPIPPPMPGGYPQGSVDPRWNPNAGLAPTYGGLPGAPGVPGVIGAPGSVAPPFAPGYSSNPVFDRNSLATRMPAGPEKSVSGPIVVAPTDNLNNPTHAGAETVARPASNYQFQQGGYR